MLHLFKSNYLAAIIILVSVTMIQGCKSDPGKTDEREKYVIPDSLMKTLTLDTVSYCPLVDAITLTGTVDFNQDNQVNIFPLVSGIIQDVKVQLGDHVTAGQVLAVVKSSEMAGYSNSLVIAQTNVTNTKKQLDAQQDLFKSGLASQLDVTTARVNYEQALSQLEMAKRVLKINGNNTQGDYIIKAPISGFIVQKNITNNTSIRVDNGTNLFTISDLKNVWIQANVYESNISKVHLGDAVDVTTLSYPGRVFKGKVDKMMNVLDPTNKVMKVRIMLPNSDYALKPQMFTSVTITSKGNGQAMCISRDALIFDHSQYFVLSYKSKDDVRITPVQVLNQLGERVYIASGVEKGDKLISSQAILIYDALNN